MGSTARHLGGSWRLIACRFRPRKIHRKRAAKTAARRVAHPAQRAARRLVAALEVVDAAVVGAVVEAGPVADAAEVGPAAVGPAAVGQVEAAVVAELELVVAVVVGLPEREGRDDSRCANANCAAATHPPAPSLREGE